MPGQGACGYCHAILATVSCPKCFALMFDGAAYCGGCGTRRARVDGDTQKVECPSCRGAMADVVIGDTVLLECRRCHGAWLDAASFEHICASSEAQAAVVHHSAAHGTPPTGEFRYRKCVACGTVMNRLNFGRLSGTVVDVCRGHGTFLDAGELHGIVRFIQGGGLDRARQRRLDDLKEQEQRLRTAHAARPPGGDLAIDSTAGFDVMALLDRLRG
jgi:Zn-finger nucleic acid-binding protein